MRHEYVWGFRKYDNSQALIPQDKQIRSDGRGCLGEQQATLLLLLVLATCITLLLLCFKA
jgi:hypothetical protein